MSGYFTSKGNLGDVEVLEYLAPISTVTDHHGYIRILYNIDRIYQQARLEGMIFFLLALTIIICSVFVVSKMLKVLVTHPILKLSKGMDKISKGELGVQVELESNNELGVMTHIFNKMSFENSQMHKQLKDINESLEKEVILTTEELDKSQSLLASVLSSSQDGIMVLKSITNEKGAIADFEWLMANPQAAANFSSEVGSIIGKQFFNRDPSFANEELFDDLCKVVETKKPLNKEIYCDFEQQRGWFHVTAVVIEAGPAITFRDVTSKKLLELDLQRKAEIDGLTQLANRGYFDKYLDEEWAACIHDEENLGIIFLDVDTFKSYNDTYGHLAGDDCLKRIASILAKTANRPRDLAARYGGEEFVLVLPRISRSGLFEMAENIQEELRALAIEHKNSTVSDIVTIGIGASFTAPTAKMDLNEFVETSDKALYASKRDGRNKVTIVDYGIT